ncbi:Amino acid permease [Rubripirellula lacrimiformis]|uniref:Amino acid permease n=1 Tax=Rubripirellula lacrimiformis TaxID=1930273 RepID=A0A517N7P7_9BACT|nr:amino acid permease [Rubripirellula lacrimiformis]QDT03164.1 Amino acid permease [Rubripirellula lacrimiformis]
MSNKISDTQVSGPAKFGTFGGVFTPCTLTILGVIMFLRFGQVVGQSGIINAVLIVLAAKAITTLTTLSLSAIATNTRVKGGGAYYLISRSLGVEFGGAIGILFFAAQAISVAMYIIGFTEAFAVTFPQWADEFTAIASLVNVGVFLCVYVGAGWTIKVQYFILAILVAAIGSFYVGAIQDFNPDYLRANLSPHYLGGENWFTMFALFFPAVTGIMAGANMSGDLANPSKSIPTGTLLAIAVTAVVYLSQVFLLGSARSPDELTANNMVIRDIALWPIAITAGVFAATLSSALGSMMGAPRILQAFARDEIFRSLRFFGAGSGLTNEPRRATVLTFAIAQVCIVLGDLNAIAPIITMFFMITYGLLNLATFYEAVTKNPSYRPTFRYSHWMTSLAGTLGCLGVMFLVNWIWATVSILFIAGLHWFIRSREIESRWGDLQSGVIFERARKALLKLEVEAYHPKNWRPIIMALSGTGWTRSHIPIYGHWLTSGHGMLTLAQVVSGDIEDHAERRDRYEKVLRNFIAKEQLEAFPAVTCNAILSDGIEALIQCSGIGGLRPNTVLMGWPRDQSRAEAFGANIRLIARMNRSILAMRFLSHRGDDSDDHSDVDEHWKVPAGTIDVWWRGMENGALMMLLAHLLHQNPGWRDNPIRLLRVVENEEAEQEVRKHLIELGASSRITIVPEVIVSSRSPAQVIAEASRSAAIVLLGFQTPDEGNEMELYQRMEWMAGDLPRVLFVDSAGGMALES